MYNTGKRLSPERLAIAEKCLDDGWSFRQITLTHHIGAVTLRKYFPGRGMDQKEAAKIGYQAMKTARTFRRMNHM